MHESMDKWYIRGRLRHPEPKNKVSRSSSLTCQRSVISRRPCSSFGEENSTLEDTQQKTTMTSFITSVLLLITLSAMTFAQVKPGGCPPRGSVGICAILCNGDQDCVGNQKCCSTACGGTTCLLPVTESVNVVKGGSCPARPTGRWTCSSTCRSDGDCRGNKKCCRNRCGAMACQNPVFNNDGDYDYAMPPVLARDNDS